MKKVIIASAIALAFGVAANAQAATVLTFSNNATPGATVGLTGYTAAFGAGKEFRMVSPITGAPGGGGEKSTYIGGESWTFDALGSMSAVSGTPSNPGSSFPGSAAGTAGTNDTLGQAAGFFGPMFNFLAPTTSNLAGAAYGPATIAATVGGFNVNFNVMEAQWGGTFFPMANVTLSCAVTGSAFNCFGEHLISIAEDPGSAGFAGWTAQYNMVGTVAGLAPAPSAVPVPAAAWLLGSGLLGLVGVARRKQAA